MGTRCLTAVYEDGVEILTLYRQFDGYFDGHGDELALFLSGIQLVNGISGERKNVANGMGCLAAQIVAHMKTEPGGFYIYKSGSRDVGEEYIYHVVKFPNDEIGLRVEDHGNQVYFGRAKDFDGRAIQDSLDVEKVGALVTNVEELKAKAKQMGYKIVKAK